MPKALELSGQKFGRLTVIGFSHRRGAKRMHQCKCCCGNLTYVETGALIAGKVVSCGCYGKEQKSKATIKRNTTHGKSSDRVYQIWFNMVRRCTDPTRPEFQAYGARGISVCSEWLTFENFYLDMGDPPPGRSSIDRIDNSKGYSKGNCRWADDFIQANNRSNNHIVVIDGVKYTAVQAAKKFGINYGTLRSRLRRGWSDERAITK